MPFSFLLTFSPIIKQNSTGNLYCKLFLNNVNSLKITNMVLLSILNFLAKILFHKYILSVYYQKVGIVILPTLISEALLYF